MKKRVRKKRKKVSKSSISKKQNTTNRTDPFKVFCKLVSRHSRILIILVICTFYAAIFYTGHLLLEVEPFRFGTIHQVVLIMISAIQIYMLYHLRHIVKRLVTLTNGYNVRIHLSLKSLKMRISSILNYLWPIIPAALFARKQIVMEYVPFSVTGIYATTVAASTVYIGLICYGQYFLTMLTVREISRISINELPFDFPDDTLQPPEWLKILYELYRKGLYAFFTVSILYTLEYALLMPEDIITYDAASNVLLINSSNPIGFVLGWLVIIVLIVFAFPIFMVCFQKFFKQLVKNLKSKASIELRLLFGESNSKIDSFYALFNLNNIMMNDGNYLVNTKTLYPAIATMMSIGINLIKLATLIWPKLAPLLP